MPHTFRCQVRSSDIDLLEHVNHVRLFDYIDEARRDFLATVDPLLAQRFVTLHDDVTFRTPVESSLSHVEIAVWVVDVAARELTLGLTMTSDEASEVLTHADAVTRLAPAASDASFEPYRDALEAHRHVADEAVV